MALLFDAMQKPISTKSTPQLNADTHAESHVLIVGVGLIGGSIAAGLRKRSPGCRITGIGRSMDRLKQAAAAGLLDDFATSTSTVEGLRDGLAVVCLPVGHIATAVRELVQAEAAELLITDAGSVKASIYQELADSPAVLRRYVGSHPIAGREQTGFEFAQADLFVDRMCVVTGESSDTADVRRIQQFWEMLGSRVHLMSADEHDRILSLTSHLPHVLASVAANCVAGEMLPFTGTGFRDTTRVAAGSAELWTQILFGNRPYMIEAIQTAERYLSRVRESLVANDRNGLEQVLGSASEIRHQLKELDQTIGSRNP